MFTRKQHMAGECTHREYYAQFAPIFRHAVAAKWSRELLAERLAEDPHLNNIPLREWDAFSFFKGAYCTANKAINGERSWSPSTVVCAAKEAAKQIAEGSW